MPWSKKHFYTLCCVYLQKLDFGEKYMALVIFRHIQIPQKQYGITSLKEYSLPSNCTDTFQLLDFSVNKPLKDHL